MSLNLCAGIVKDSSNRPAGPPFLLASDPEQKVVVVCAGKPVMTVLRRHLVRFDGSYPHQIFRDGSVFLGNTIRWKGGVWVWDVRNARSHDAPAVAELMCVIADTQWKPFEGISPEARELAISWKMKS